MTIIKQRAVTQRGHQNHLRDYINNDKKVLLRDCQNMEGLSDIKRWASFMERTREGFGHNTSSRKGKDGRPAKNTILYHQILGFNPDECDLNGGKLSPEDCMRYAKEYIQNYYPNQQVVFALHNEYCKEDRTHRYAVHMVINRSDLMTGRRLDEGRGTAAKAARAKRIRTMDAAWDLKQVKEGERNSLVHKKQPSKTEREIEGRGETSYKTNLRELCRIAAQKAKDIYEYRELLEDWGVDTQFRKGALYVVDRDNNRYSFSLKRLDADLGGQGLETRFHENMAAAVHVGGNRLSEKDAASAQMMKERYLADIRSAYLDYRKMAREMQGTALSQFPKLKLKRPPEEIADDQEVKRAVLAYWRGGDELRVRLASEVPYVRPSSVSGSSGSQQVRPVQAEQMDERNGTRETGR